MSAERVYRLLLRTYPRTFRAEYGEEMLLLFRDEYRSGKPSVAFWAVIVRDIALSAPSMWMEVCSLQMKNFTRIVEVVMKVAGILAVLLGIYGLVGAVGDASVGMRVGPSRVYVVAISLGILAAVLLLIAGAAVLRSPVSARNTASVTLVASLAMVMVARLLHPWMGALALIVAIGAPIVLLATLQWPTKSRSTV